MKDSMRKWLLLLLAFFFCSLAGAQMAKFQALYLYNFAKNTSWPLEDKGKILTITVIGDNALSTELKSIVKNKKIGDRSISVLDAATASGLSKSDIIYLGESKSSQIGQLVAAQASNRVLIVSGTKGQCAQGACISFLPGAGTLNFEIHEGNIASHGLKVAPKLVSLGKQVF